MIHRDGTEHGNTTAVAQYPIPKVLVALFLLLCSFRTIESSLPQSTPAATSSIHESASNLLSPSKNDLNDTELIEEDWRSSLPPELRDEKGAPLHRIIIEQLNDHDQSSSGKKVTLYLLGTSHVSRTSCQDAKLLMEHVRPDVLFVELCAQRVGLMLSSPNIPDNQQQNQQSADFPNNRENNLAPLSQKSMLKGATLLSKIQSDYAKKLNVTIGGEFQSAFQSAWTQQRSYWGAHYSGYDHRFANLKVKTTNHPRGHRPCAIVLGDRPVRITILRAWESLRIFGKLRLLLGLLWSSIKQPSEEELREWMESILNDRSGKNDLLTKAMEELGKSFPTLKRVIIEERDEFMVAKLFQVASMLMTMEDIDSWDDKVIVAVVGAGHCAGMVEKLTTDGVRGKLNFSSIRPEEILPALVETSKMKLTNNEDLHSLVTDVVQFDYSFAMEHAALQ